MNIQFHKKSPTEGIITIQIKEPDYASIVEKRLREYSQKSNIKGFRPGHAPISIIKKIYGSSILFKTISTLLNDTLSKYLQESNITIVGEPMPHNKSIKEVDWSVQREFSFSYDIGLVTLSDLNLSNVPQVVAYKINQTTEQTIDSISQEIRRTYGKKQDVDKSAIGDMLYGVLDHASEGLITNVRFSLEQAQEAVAESLTNLRVGDKVTLELHALLQQGIQLLGLSEKTLKKLLSLEKLCEFTVEKIERIIPAELNQVFFDRILGVGEVNSLAAFRTKLQEITIRNKQQEANRYLNQVMQQTLLTHIAMDLPDDFLKRWLQYKYHDLSQEDLANYYQDYVRGLKWELIIKKIMEIHNIEITPEALIQETKHRFKNLYQKPDEHLDQLVQTFLRENKGDNYRKMYQALLSDQVLKLLKDQMCITTQAISVEEFDKLA